MKKINIWFADLTHTAQGISAATFPLGVSFVYSYAKKIFGKEFNYDLRRALDIQYRRITLVAKQGGERMTIDTDLRFYFAGQKLELGTDRFIVETKSQLGRGFADKSLLGIGSRSTKKCSKYCVGMAALGLVERYNRFLPTMRKLGLEAGRFERRIENPLAA